MKHLEMMADPRSVNFYSLYSVGGEKSRWDICGTQETQPDMLELLVTKVK